MEILGRRIQGEFVLSRFATLGRDRGLPGTFARRRWDGIPISDAAQGIVRVISGMLAAGALWGLATAQAQVQQAVCSSTPGGGQRIECTKPEGSTGDIVIDSTDIDISTTENEVRPISVLQAGDGDIHVTLRNVDLHANGATDQPFAHALRIAHGSGAGRPKNGGDIFVNIQGGSFTTEGLLSRGIIVSHDHSSTGDIHLTLRDVVVITNSRVTDDGTLTTGRDTSSDAVHAFSRGDGGDIVIDVARSRITTEGKDSHAISALSHFNGNAGTGDIVIKVSDGTEIETRGDTAIGVLGWHNSIGDIVIDLQSIRIATDGYWAYGVVGIRDPPRVDESAAGPRGGDIVIKAANVVIVSAGTALDTFEDTWAHGIYARHGSVGDIIVDLRGGRIETRGVRSYGIFAKHEKRGTAEDLEPDGSINVATRDGHTITTTGVAAHGILVEHMGTEKTRTISVIVGGSIDVQGADASGIAVGRVRQSAVDRAAALDADGYRKQTVTVNGRVHGGTGDNAAGIFLAGGGRVIIGPMGTVGARSGIAIVADGDNIVDGRTFPRKLHVQLLPDGRPVSDLLDGIIRNDGGVTILAVTGTVLYDSMTGPTGLWALNGARDVTLVDGFSGLDFSSPDAFIYRYGPRAAVYEALPGVMLRLNGHGNASTSPRQRSPDSPVWIRLDGARAVHKAGRATVGARYDVGRADLEIGLDVGLGEHLTGSISGRHVTGSAKVSAPTRGGTIDATGYGLSIGFAWQGSDYYGDGRLAATWFDVDAASDTRGVLVEGVDALAHSFDLEAGRRFRLDEERSLTARAWLHRSELAVDPFTDAVHARVSVGEADRLTVGVGGLVETDVALSRAEERLSLHGSFGLEQTLGEETSVLVSGEELRSDSTNARILLGAGGTYRRDRFTLGCALRVHGLGSRDRDYGGFLDLRVAF